MRREIKWVCLGVLFVIALSFMGCNGEVESGEVLEVTESPMPTNTPTPTPIIYDINLAFVGDISLAEASNSPGNDFLFPYDKYLKNGKDITTCIDPVYIELMQSADIMWANSEFCFSERGSRIPSKMWCFRARPSSVALYNELGVDIVGLANNHIYDYGKEAFLDTLDTLKNADIEYVGAGANLSEAMTPVYFEIQGLKIAYLAASRAEKYVLTPLAKEDEPGILRCYEDEKHFFLDAIKEARANADLVIAVIHWGKEGSLEYEQVQLDTAKEYIDAGVDIIIGGHTHTAQGAEYYNGKPIFYSIGDFWFDDDMAYDKIHADTYMVKVHITGEEGNPQIEASILPGIQNDRVTLVADEENRKRILEKLNKYTRNAFFDENGVLVENNH